ncbi:P-loop containing nucleoside triphosphate hydrolase protein [Xylaria sp. FL0933]|nr:P-loop containing nucleoside triphosphate hydrolase protein [Xylaria sp. FL0933]
MAVAETEPRRYIFEKVPCLAKQEWDRLKSLDSEIKSEAIEELMGLVGLEQVKQQFLSIWAKVQVFKKQGLFGHRAERYHVIMLGNPGTGKTTVARIYGKFLREIHYELSSWYFKEFWHKSGAQLLNMGAQTVGSEIERMEDEGAVVFVDETYQLTSLNNSGAGGTILDIVLTKMEERFDKMAFVFAGYNKDMQSFFEHNDGLRSRIPLTLQFEDFSHAELLTILIDKIQAKYNDSEGNCKMKVEGGLRGKFMRIAIRRLASGRGLRGFGNARAVENLLSQISERQARRLSELEPTILSRNVDDLDYFEFTQEDIIGPDPSKIFKCPAYKELNKLIELNAVKEAVENMIGMIKTNYERELKEVAPFDLSLNQVFFGAPGTGKTTVAKLYGQILSCLALLSDGEVVVKNPSDFIGDAVGVSESNTRNILAATKGKVLVIDEAYSLGSKSGGSKFSYGASVLDTIVAEVQGVPGEDRCIILVGYEDRLRDMLQHANPGLGRRFRMDRGFHFEDFTTDQLMAILEKKMRDEDLQATPEAIEVARQMCERTKFRANFSNAGEIINLLDIAKLNFQSRLQKQRSPQYDDRLLPEDFDPNHGRRVDAAAKCKAAIEGTTSDTIVEKYCEWIRKAELAVKHKMPITDLVPTRFIIKGPPGTGKRTAAREVGKVFYGMGLLATPEIVEKSTSDFIGRYVGHTAPKTKAVLESSLGKVLIVRDAVRLAERSPYASETVGEIESLLNSPRYRNKIGMVLVGTTEEIDILKAMRPAVAALFKNEVVSQPLTSDYSLALLEQTLLVKGVTVPFLKDTAGDPYQKCKALMTTLAKSPMWENATTVQELGQTLLDSLYEDWHANILNSKDTSPNGLSQGLRGTTAQKKKLFDNNNLPQMPEALQHDEPPTLSDLATRFLTPLLGNPGQNRKQAPQPQSAHHHNYKLERMGPLERGASAPVDAPQPEPRVSAEEFQRLQELYRESKKRSANLSPADRAREQQEMKSIAAILQGMGGVCEYEFEWFRVDSNTWHCRGGLHEAKLIGGKWQVGERD